MTQLLPTRTVDGVQLPAPGDWQLDPSHTTVEFVGRHLMVSKVRGRFPEVEGVIHVADDPADSSVEVTIQTASVDSRDANREPISAPRTSSTSSSTPRSPSAARRWRARAASGR